MPGIFSAFTDAQKAGQEFGDSVAASKDLQQAMQETPKDESGKADLFTTYQKAGQIAMQSGQVKVADKLLKQANEYKGDALKLKLDELKVQSAQLERFEQHIQGLNTPEEFIDSIKHSELPLDQQMQLMTLAQKDPKQFKDLMLKQSMTGKERAQVEMKVLEEQRKKTHDEAEVKHWADQNRNQALNASRRETPADKRKADIATYQEKKLIDQIDRIDDDARKATQAIETKVAGKGYDSVKAEQEIKAIEAKRKIDKQFAQKNLDKFRKETDGGSDKPEPKATTSTDTPPPADHVKYLEQNPTTENKASFDKEYGPGSADKALKGAKSGSKAGAGQKTHDGYPARENADGSYSTEVSITVTNPKLNNGKPTNIPSLWKGKEVDEDTAVRNALATGKSYKAFNSINEAVTAAKARSEAGGAGADSKKELTDEEQLAEDLSKTTGVQERNAIRNDYNIRQDRKAKQAKQKAIAAKGKEKTEAAIAKAQKQGLVLSGMSGTQLKFVDPKTGKEVLESEL